ncbi:flagellar basal body rod protein FlgB [Campylobacter pinnipediorum]|uniref:Flagellar basal body rod protein FlgB n=1 Tax=Campylobacter pinnipediorum subsp. pinnipediorum TaxID=1660067 RepID=A0AAX0LCD7_9BACT|nr:flagellar basal body rod protein FlgB [Campylobacter pinnipediorum]AQW82576.1 flagellar proximal rod protein [Campylobacter pinnipediorum subsp. pinnipediorum]AQW84261.1 flagellar proximal rod protein [Campylobacter pinnipediorum subsp. pinnipediorum]AQW85886.1 flagellar proximal rod protein [Campylobacter pinnipediorum subsp. caledonicus]OPA77071.1 flagellar basal body rod protein FlgB [Campylobacter pinnipediorum subsp. pinnipediorum]OPA78863.1 flagellar basal body rod protein FlgB [Campy
MFVLETSKSRPLVESAMSARELRQKMISSNIANIDTPFYKSRDIGFESELSSRANEIYNKTKSKELKLAKTNDKHIDMVGFPRTGLASVFLRDGHLARNDANTVDLDVETTELSKNYIMLNALDSAYKRDSSIFKSVIDASGKM